MKTARDRLKETLDKFTESLKATKYNKGIYSCQRQGNDVFIEPILPVRTIKLDRDFEYNKNVSFDDLMEAMQCENPQAAK